MKDDFIVLSNRRGYSQDAHSYSQEAGGTRAISSAWRDSTDRRFWSVFIHHDMGGFMPTGLYRAVVDDFGNIRRVP